MNDALSLWRGLGPALIAACASVAGCTPGADSGAQVDCTEPGDIDCSPDVGGAGNKSDQWNSVNDPSRFATNLVYRFDDLPTSGATERTAWASTYWPYMEDSTNVRWQGDDTLSPLEKYDLVFNGWKPSEAFKGLRPMTSCGDEYDKDYYEQLGPAAKWMSTKRGNGAMRDGKDSDGDEKIDECDEDYDGIEPWWGLCHAWVPAAVLEPEPQAAAEKDGVRFDVSDLTALLITAYDGTESMFLGSRCNAKEVERDPVTNRIMQDECRDTNAGSFHVVAANMLGLRKRAFAEDRTFDYEVWNQPVVRFAVTEQRKLTASEANVLLKAAPRDAYAFNAKAVEFIEIQAELDYITESLASTSPTTPTIDRYTRTDEYHYILELDADRKIIGGEWLSDRHPDFLWLPLRAGGTRSNPYVDLREVQKLVRSTLGPVEGPVGGDGGVTEDPPTPACEDAYRDGSGRCRRGDGAFAPAACCQ